MYVLYKYFRSSVREELVSYSLFAAAKVNTRRVCTEAYAHVTLFLAGSIISPIPFGPRRNMYDTGYLVLVPGETQQDEKNFCQSYISDRQRFSQLGHPYEWEAAHDKQDGFVRSKAAYKYIQVLEPSLEDMNVYRSSYNKRTR